MIQITFSPVCKWNKIKSSDIVNVDNDALCFVEISHFGINKLYSLIHTESFKLFIENYRNTNCEIFYGLIGRDTPPTSEVNLKSVTIDINQKSLLPVVQYSQLINGLNEFYEENLNDQFAVLEMFLNGSAINLNTLTLTMDSKYLVLYNDHTVDFTNNPRNICDGAIGVLVYLERLNAWQYLSVTKFHRLLTIDNLLIKYGYVNDIYNHDKIEIVSEFSANILEEILTLANILPVDIQLREYFSTRAYTEPYFEKDRYASIEIKMSQSGIAKKLIITQAELGYDKYKDLIPKYYRIYDDDFWMLGLINKIAKTKLI